MIHWKGPEASFSLRLINSPRRRNGYITQVYKSTNNYNAAVKEYKRLLVCKDYVGNLYAQSVGSDSSLHFLIHCVSASKCSPAGLAGAPGLILPPARWDVKLALPLRSQVSEPGATAEEVSRTCLRFFAPKTTSATIT